MGESSNESGDSEEAAAPQAEQATAPVVVCLGASAGGLEALESFFSAMPPDTGASFVVVVHLSPDFKSALPELLARKTRMKVAAARDNQRLKPNHIHIIPPKVNMVIEQGRLRLRQQDRGHGLNLPIDIFLESMVVECGERSVALILSGTGSDGTRGLGLIKEAGGMALVQSPESSKFDGMPRSALNAGTADCVDAPEGLARRVTRILSSTNRESDLQEQEVEPELDTILNLLKVHGTPDLRHYRRSMVARRVQRRMTLSGIGEIKEYITRLQKEPDECSLLRRDLLIGVTSFFRDSEVFATLEREFMHDYLAKLDPYETVRIWVPACSTGQEVYSIAMLCAEASERDPKRTFNIFATDVHRPALDFASNGVYSLSDVVSVPEDLQRKYFTPGERFHVSRAIREMVIFARHDLVRDPPFTKMNLVSCRNFLIYMESPMQEQVLAALHFALKPDGLLMLGNAESVAPLEAEFEAVSQSARIFRKATAMAHPALRRRNTMIDPVELKPRSDSFTPVPAQREEASRTVLESVLDSDGMTCALMTGAGVMLEVFADPLGLFRLARGKPTNEATKIVPKEVSVALSTGLHRISKGEEQISYAVALPGDKGASHGTVQLRALPAEDEEQPKVLMTLRRFDESAEVHYPDRTDVQDAESERTRMLEAELRHNKETLQATIEELQTTNEEQQSTNEELVAANEELQSTNEELQSVNEELHTVNVELQRKNEDLSVMTADLDNILNNIEVGTLFLDKRLAIRKFTPGISDVIHIAEHDVGRSIQEFNHNVATDLVADIRHVIDTGTRIDRQVSAIGGAWYYMSIIPYRTRGGAEEGVLLTFVDVTGTKNMEELARSINEQLEDANRRLLDQTSELEELFSITSHDLKRPVTALDGLLKLALKKIGSDNDAPKKHIELALSECARMDRLIHDLAHVSGIRDHDDVAEELDLQSWMDAIIDDFRPRAEESGIQLNYSCDRGTVRVVRIEPEQALRNIIENAILYGSTHENPRIDVSCQLEKGTMRLSVTDNGKGIAEEHQERVFELFRRLDPGIGEGSGVGLVAARRLVAKAGGTVQLESAPDKGAKFTIRLPIDKAHEKEPDKHGHVLLVEDDTADAKTAMRHLDSRYQITWATTLNEALESVQQEHFDLVLLDLSLPDGHGLELLTEMRKSLNRNVPIVILTGHSGIVEEKALRASTDGYLTKAAAQQKSLLQATIEDAIANRVA